MSTKYRNQNTYFDSISRVVGISLKIFNSLNGLCDSCIAKKYRPRNFLCGQRFTWVKLGWSQLLAVSGHRPYSDMISRINLFCYQRHRDVLTCFSSWKPPILECSFAVFPWQNTWESLSSPTFGTWPKSKRGGAFATENFFSISYNYQTKPCLNFGLWKLFSRGSWSTIFHNITETRSSSIGSYSWMIS